MCDDECDYAGTIGEVFMDCFRNDDVHDRCFCGSGWCGCCPSDWGHSCDIHRYCLVMERIDLFVLLILWVYTLSFIFL